MLRMAPGELDRLAGRIAALHKELPAPRALLTGISGVDRSQEGLSALAIVNAYRQIYFPAQQLHFRHDRPREQADLVLLNDLTSA